jgi:small nuclear ribonucleoprotein (snRNP)-like protein
MRTVDDGVRIMYDVHMMNRMATERRTKRMFSKGDTVRFIDPQSEGRVVIVGRLKAIDEFRAVVEELYAASVWGESNLQRGLVHSVDPSILEAKGA